MKKINFSDKYGLTEAVLSGRKTQTRRVISEKLWDKWTEYDDFCNSVSTAGLGEIGVSVTREYYDEKEFFLENAPYNVGEVVAVAQAYNDFYNDECDPRIFPDGAGWTNKMFVRADLMPHQIRITNVRVERLNDISESDCRAEGIISNIDPMTNLTHYMFPNWDGDYISNRGAYATLIDRISGKGTWESNPYVFVYDFELIK